MNHCLADMSVLSGLNRSLQSDLEKARLQFFDVDWGGFGFPYYAHLSRTEVTGHGYTPESLKESAFLSDRRA